MTPERRVRRAFEAWRDVGVPADAPDSTAEREAKVLAALTPAIGAAPRVRARRVRTRLVLLAAAMLSLSALVTAIATRVPHERSPVAVLSSAQMRPTGAPALLIRSGTTHFAEPGLSAPLDVGDEISIADGGGAELELPSHAHADVAPATRFRLTSSVENEVVELVRGTVSFSVPRLAPPKTLSIVTPDASVVVHGTRFRVTVESEAGKNVTSVTVTEGEVAVVYATGHTLLHPGQQWRSASYAEPQADRSIQPATEPRAGTTGSGATTALPSSPRPADSLAEQNRLYRAALAARDRGDDARTVSLLDQLLTRFPNSPLAPEARKQRENAAERRTKSRP